MNEPQPSSIFKLAVTSFEFSTSLWEAPLLEKVGGARWILQYCKWVLVDLCAKEMFPWKNAFNSQLPQLTRFLTPPITTKLNARHPTFLPH